MTGFGFTTPLFISVMLLSQVVTSKEIEVPLKAKSLGHETAYPYEPPSDLITPEIQRGLHVLFQRELEHYEFDENNHDISGNYEEVNSYLWLLGYLEIEPVDPDSKPRWHWPRSIGRNSDVELPKAAFIHMELFYGVDGRISEIKLKFCSVGNSTDLLDANNVSGRACKTLARSYERWFDNWKMVPVIDSYSKIPRVTDWKRYIRNRVTRECWSQTRCWENWSSDDGTYTDLPKRQIRSLNDAIKAENWSRLADLALKRADQHLLYRYYAGLGLAKQGFIEDAESHWLYFLENSAYQYPKFSANAATALIGNFYGQGEDGKVVSTGRHFDLEQFRRDFPDSSLSTSVTVGQIQYFSSLSLMERPRIASALKGFMQLQEDELVGSDPDIRSLVNEQLYGLLKQIKEVAHAEGRAR